MKRLIESIKQYIMYVANQSPDWLIARFGEFLVLIGAVTGTIGILKAPFASTAGTVFDDYVYLFEGFLFVVTGAVMMGLAELLKPTGPLGRWLIYAYAGNDYGPR